MEEILSVVHSAPRLPEDPPLQEEMLSLTAMPLLMGQGRVRLEGTIPDGTGWLSGATRRLRAACYSGKAVIQAAIP